jgi:DNA replication protein DnaC
MNRALVYELATARSIAQREDVLFLGLPGTGQATWHKRSAAPPFCRATASLILEAHTLLEELAEATLAGARKEYLAELATVPLLIVDDLGVRKLAHTAAEDLLELERQRVIEMPEYSSRSAASARRHRKGCGITHEG